MPVHRHHEQLAVLLLHHDPAVRARPLCYDGRHAGRQLSGGAHHAFVPDHEIIPPFVSRVMLPGRHFLRPENRPKRKNENHRKFFQKLLDTGRFVWYIKRALRRRGRVVQSVRTLACHARGRGFKSLLGRHPRSESSAGFVCCYSSAGRAHPW